MNKIYKVVWSKAKHCYVVVSELAKRNGKGCGARSLRMAAVSMGVAAALLCTGAVLPIFGESVAEAAEVTVTNITGTYDNPVFTTIPENAHYSGDGGYVTWYFDDAGVNTLTITGSEVSNITISGRDTGGAAGDVEGYTVNVSGTNTKLGDVSGGKSWYGTASGNTHHDKPHHRLYHR